MIKGLYNSFAERWYRGGSVWFYSDPHFGDEEMKHLRKNYISDDEQVKRINSKLGKNDTIIFLGDIGDTSFMKKIKGFIFAIGFILCGFIAGSCVNTVEAGQKNFFKFKEVI